MPPEQPEAWKPVVGYEGHYEVSNLGRVKSLARMARLNYRPRPLRERILRPGRASNGYDTVVLFDPGGRRSHCIHRLVAEAFIPKPSACTEVNHIDGVKANCRVENLEWCTSSYNTQHAYDTGLLIPYIRSPQQRYGRYAKGASREI